MKLRVSTSPRADQDIETIVRFIALRSPSAGARFYLSYSRTAQLLGQQPGIGRVREFPDPRLREVRTWPVKGFEAHLIVYLVEADVVRVIRVLHGSRDLGPEVERGLQQE